MTTNYKILIGLGVIAAGVGIYMYTRKKDEPKSNLVNSNTNSCPNGFDENGRCKGAAWGGKKKLVGSV